MAKEIIMHCDSITELLPEQHALLEERFWAKVSRSSADACWLWIAGTSKAGYGQIGLPGTGKIMYAHRVSWELHHGAIPEGMTICHRCDTPLCVNPRHMFLGTQGDNIRDARDKGRLVIPRLIGEEHNMVKLSEADVRAIRFTYAQGGITLETLGERYGVSEVQIGRIVRRVSWRHI